jgi:bifunctional oligoribonuclease and PAP phosphatase NrnA
MNNAGDPQYQEKLRAIAARLKSHSGSIVVAAHEDPDGDALGSVLGLTRALQKLGLHAVPVGIPPKYLEYLPEAGELTPSLETLPEGALLVALDSAETTRVVGVPMTQPGIAIINIDHHGSNPRFGEIALVSPDKAATALMIKDLVETLGVTLDARIAAPLLTGIITDTGFFRNSNANAEVLRSAADLTEAGASMVAINEALSITTRNSYKLQSEVYATIAYELNGKLITAYVDDAMLERVGCTWEEVESLVGSLRNAEGTVLACLYKDYGDRVKISLRSRGQVSAQNIAIACGGGGHVPAAGATIMEPFDGAKKKLLEEARKELERVGVL